MHTPNEWDAIADPKLERVRSIPAFYQACPFCKAIYGHKSGCKRTGMDDPFIEAARARFAESIAKKRAEFWLRAVRDMHGKFAQQKLELRNLRKRLAKGEEVPNE